MINMLVVVEYRLLLVLVSYQFYGTLNFFLTQAHMGLEISKYCSYSFHPISTKLCEVITFHGGIQAIICLANRAKLIKFCGTFKF